MKTQVSTFGIQKKIINDADFDLFNQIKMMPKNAENIQFVATNVDLKIGFSLEQDICG